MRGWTCSAADTDYLFDLINGDGRISEKSEHAGTKAIVCGWVGCHLPMTKGARDMPGRYQNEDRDDYYNEPYRDRDYESRGANYRDYDERYPGDYRSRGYSDDEERFAYNSPQRESFARDSRYERHGARNEPIKSSSGTGMHRGKGPKGYTRTDERIKEDVSDALMEDADLDASDIEVSVKKGEVTLQGQVATRQDKRRAEDCAEACAGVADVQNNIKVRSATATSAKGTA